jgi:O-antigen/teichoic acid export membrane protein
MSLKAQVISSVKWNGASMVVITAIHFVTIAVLARLLSPLDFGLMGMIMVVIGFAQAFGDMGFSNAIIQRQDVPQSHLSSFFWVNVLTGMLLFICIILVRPVAVIYFKQPVLSGYLGIAAFSFLIMPFAQIFNTLLKKELRFRTLSKIDIVGTVVYSTVTVGLALAKLGVLSLILGQLVRTAFTVGILFFIFRKTWLPKFHFNIKEIKSYLSFGAFQMGERAANYLSANSDYIIIGRFLGPSALGFYTLAYQLMRAPLAKINPIITNVAFPAFSKVQNDNFRIRKGYCKALNYISTLTFPVLTGMVAVAPEFVRLVYGEKWIPSIIVLQILCLVGLFKSVGGTIGSVLLAKGRADIGFYWNVFWVIMVLLGIIVGVQWGIVGVAVAILILESSLFFAIQSIVNRLIELKFSEYFRAVQTAIVCSALMLAGIILIKTILGNINILAVFVVAVAVGGIIYIASYHYKDKVFFLELKSVLKGI